MFVEITDVAKNSYVINPKLVEYYYYNDVRKLVTVSVGGVTFLMVVSEFNKLGI